jgi:polyribonucleotide nucleotidyltransferase
VKAHECSEEDLVKALELAHDAIRVHIKAQEELKAKVGITAKRDYAKPEHKEELHAEGDRLHERSIYQIAKAGSSKHERSDAFDKLKKS